MGVELQSPKLEHRPSCPYGERTHSQSKVRNAVCKVRGCYRPVGVKQLTEAPQSWFNAFLADLGVVAAVGALCDSTYYCDATDCYLAALHSVPFRCSKLKSRTQCAL